MNSGELNDGRIHKSAARDITNAIVLSDSDAVFHKARILTAIENSLAGLQDAIILEALDKIVGALEANIRPESNPNNYEYKACWHYELSTDYEGQMLDVVGLQDDGWEIDKTDIDASEGEVLYLMRREKEEAKGE